MRFSRGSLGFVTAANANKKQTRKNARNRRTQNALGCLFKYPSRTRATSPASTSRTCPLKLTRASPIPSNPGAHTVNVARFVAPTSLACALNALNANVGSPSTSSAAYATTPPHGNPLRSFSSVPIVLSTPVVAVSTITRAWSLGVNRAADCECVASASASACDDDAEDDDADDAHRVARRAADDAATRATATHGARASI